MSEQEIDVLRGAAHRAPAHGGLRRIPPYLTAGTVFYPSDIVAVRFVQHSLGRRPIVWAITAGREFAGLSG